MILSASVRIDMVKYECSSRVHPSPAIYTTYIVKWMISYLSCFKKLSHVILFLILSLSASPDPEFSLPLGWDEEKASQFTKCLASSDPIHVTSSLKTVKPRNPEAQMCCFTSPDCKSLLKRDEVGSDVLQPITIWAGQREGMHSHLIHIFSQDECASYSLSLSRWMQDIFTTPEDKFIREDKFTIKDELTLERRSTLKGEPILRWIYTKVILYTKMNSGQEVKRPLNVNTHQHPRLYKPRKPSIIILLSSSNIGQLNPRQPSASLRLHQLWSTLHLLLQVRQQHWATWPRAVLHPQPSQLIVSS